MEKSELISVIMPVYNSMEFLRSAVNSILNQTYTNFEFIIVDDGSTDDSASIISQFKDSRIKFYKREHKGITEQLNYGLRKAQGVYFARMDADDISYHSRFEEQLKVLSEKKIDIVGSNIEYIDLKGKTIGFMKYPEEHEKIEFQMPIFQSVSHPTILSRINCIKILNGYNDFPFCEDFDFFLRILKAGYRFYNVQKILLKYRFHYNYLKGEKHKIQNKTHIYLAENYIKDQTNPCELNKYYFRLGLVHYYHGSMKDARNNLLLSHRYSNSINSRIFRYLIPTFLGTKVFNFLRSQGIVMRIKNILFRNFRM